MKLQKKKDPFVSRPIQNIARLTIGSAVGYGISLILLPLLTRLYEPEAFGSFALLWALTQIIGLAGTLRMEKAIFISKNEVEREQLKRIGRISSGGLAVLVILALVGGDYFADILSAYPSLHLLPLTAFFQSVILFEIASQNKNDRYERSARARAFQGSFPSLFAIGFAYTPLSEMGLSYGLVLSQFIATDYLIRFSGGYYQFLQSLHPKGLRESFRRHVNFFRYTLPHEVFGGISAQSTSLLIPIYFGSGIAGLYFLAHKFVMVPSLLIGSSSAQVYFHELAINRGELPSRVKLFRQTLLMTALVSATLFTVVYLLGPLAISVVFGDSWGFSGLFVRMVAPWAAVHLVGSVVSQTPQAMGAQRTAMRIEIINGLTRLSLLTIGFLAGNILLGISLFLAASIMFSGGRIIWYSRLIRNANL